MIAIACIMGLLWLLTSFILYYEHLARLEAEKCWKYWKEKAEERGANSAKYYIALGESYEEARKLFAFIGSKYHGES